jgi:hypothetical protein
MAWENTIAPFIETLGFVRDKNDQCVFYHPTTDMIVLLYVDDIYMDGMSEDVDIFLRSVEHKIRVPTHSSTQGE